MDKTINLYLGKHISDIHIDNTMFRKLLNEIIKEAAQKRISVYDWLYSKKHIRKSIEEGVQEANLIWNVERLDLDRCWEDCERLLLKCGYTVEYDEHNKECFESFIYRIVLFYIEEQGKLKTRCPEAASYRDESRDSYTVPALQHRLSRLEKLENAFNSKLCSTGKLYQLDYWGLSNQRTDKRTEQIILRISEEIQKFFQTMGLTAYDSYFSNTEFQSVAQDERQMHLDSRKQYSSDYLKKRILWVIHLMSNGDIDERFGPIFMLNMVMACKIQLFGDPSNDKVQPNTMLIRQPLYFSRIPPAKQRCAHLQLLCALRDIFSLSDEDLYANLREYLCLYGVSILSYDELELWTRILREEYDRIPYIGFQLCFYDYCNQCIPLHFERLNYRPYSVLHLGGYFQFYLKNQQKLRDMAKQLYQKYRNEVREYKKVWKKPELRGAELEKNLLQISHRIPLDLTEFEDVNCYDESELRLLILETILQMQIRMHAIQVMLEGFSRVYMDPLESHPHMKFKQITCEGANIHNWVIQ